jgi:hypothetical protein
MFEQKVEQNRMLNFFYTGILLGFFKIKFIMVMLFAMSKYTFAQHHFK